MAGIDLTCSICLTDLTEDNKVLSCQHTYHTTCLKELVRVSERGLIVCPDCRGQYLDDIDSLPHNIWVNRALEARKHQALLLREPHRFQPLAEHATPTPVEPDLNLHLSQEEQQNNEEEEGQEEGEEEQEQPESRHPSPQQVFYEVTSLQELIETLELDTSNVGKSFIEWKMKLQENSEASLPPVEGIKTCDDIDPDDINLCGDRLLFMGSFYESFYIFKLAYETYQRAGNFDGMTKCIVDISRTLSSMRSTDSNTKQNITLKSIRTAEDTLSLIDNSPCELKVKAHQKAKCLFAIGNFQRALLDYSTEILYYEQSIAVMDADLEHPERYFVYGKCYFCKGASFFMLKHFEEAMLCLQIARKVFKKVTDSPREPELLVKSCDSMMATVKSSMKMQKKRKK